MANYSFLVTYDGTNYLGWQKTKMGPSIEEELEKALSTILQAPVTLQAASRTDAGVHAHGQVVNFFADAFDERRVLRSFNGLLPYEITVSKLKQEAGTFHPTLDNKGKIYRYFICTNAIQLPQYRKYSWHCFDELDLTLIESAIHHFLGTQNFLALCNQKPNPQPINPLCTLKRIELTEHEDGRLLLEVEGDRFLYKMVRNLVGTLIDIGRSRIVFNGLKEASRCSLGVTAPAHGLVLQKVLY